MNDLQAIIDFQIELHKFINIDLFSRGLYQIRVNHHINSKLPHKIEVQVLDTETGNTKKRKENESLTNVVFPSSIINGVAVSKTFNILYKNEEKILNDIIHFKDHLIVNSSNCLKQLSEIEFYLDVELWFTESNYVPSNQELIRLMYKRQLKLHFDVAKGLNYYLPVTFDYFHLSTITLSVHACLVTLCLPYLSKQGLNGKTSSINKLELEACSGLGYDQLFFGCTFNEIQNQIKANCKEILNLRQRRAQLLHWQLCSLLLISIQSISRKFNEYLKILPPLVQFKFRKERSLTNFQLNNLSNLAQKCHQSCLENSFKSNSQDFIDFQNAYFAKEILLKTKLNDKESNKKINSKDDHSNLNGKDVQMNSTNDIDCVDGLNCVDANILIEKKDDKIVDKNDNILISDDLSTSIYQPEDYIASIVSDLAYICGSLIIVWQSFIKLVTHNERINQHLSKIHHLHRCKRFAEFFFVKEKPSNQLISLNQNSQFMNEIIDKLRKSSYLTKLPVCQIECVALDGDPSTMPFIFEEKFNFNEKSISKEEIQTTKQIEKNQNKSTDKNLIDKNVNEAVDKNSNDKVIKIDNDDKKLRRSSSDLSTNSSSLTDSSTDANTNNSSSAEDTTKKVKRTTSSKLRDKFVSNLNKLNLNSGITRRKSSISYLSKQEQQKIVLNGDLSSSSSTNDSNNSSLNSQLTNKSMNVETTDTSTIKIDSPLIKINDCNSINNETPSKNIIVEDCSAKLINFKGYKGIKGEIEEFLLDSNGYSIVETISLNNIGKMNGKNQTSLSTVNKKHTSKHKKLANSESLPDLSVKHLQKTIKKMTKKNSKKLKIKKDPSKKESKRIKSADYSNGKMKSDLLIDTISLNFSNNLIDSLYKNFELDEIDERFSDLERFIDEDNDKTTNNESSSLIDFSNVKQQDQLISSIDDQTTIDNAIVNKCTILEMFTRNTCLVCGIENCDNNCNCVDFELTIGTKNHRLSMITNELIAFVKSKEQFRQELGLKTNGWNIYSDFCNQASRIPYFQCDGDLIKTFNTDGACHLIICVHGLSGNCADLRLIKTYLELGLPFSNFEFIMSESNQGKTYDSFEVMTDRLCKEILDHVNSNCIQPSKVSFIGHSLGNIIIRSVLRKPELSFLLPKLHCFLSLSGPHLGTVYMTNNLVNFGLFFMQKWKKSASLLQLCLKDHVDPYKTFIYNLSKDSKMHLFKYVLLCGSSQDHYVPRHSAHIQICDQSLQDNSSIGKCYRDMIDNIMKPFLNIESKSNSEQINLQSNGKTEIKVNEKLTNQLKQTKKEQSPANRQISELFQSVENSSNIDEDELSLKKCTKLMRFDVWHPDGGGTNALIGRQAHIAVLDCELFIEKFMTIVGLKYFS